MREVSCRYIYNVVTPLYPAFHYYSFLNLKPLENGGSNVEENIKMGTKIAGNPSLRYIYNVVTPLYPAFHYYFFLTLNPWKPGAQMQMGTKIGENPGYRYLY